MGLGTLMKDVLSFGGTARRRNKKAKKLRAQENEQIRLNTETAQQMFDRDLGQSQFQGLAADPALVEAQRRALGQTEQVAREGYTDTDRLAMQQQLNDAARYEQSQRETLGEQARARGIQGSGLDIAAQLAAQQAGADRAMSNASNMAIAGRQRTYDANQDAATMAAQQRAQGFGEQAQVAGNVDQYGQWRTGQQSADAQALMNARLGQAQNYAQQAQGMEDAFAQGVNQATQIGGAITQAFTAANGGGGGGAGGGGATTFGHGAGSAPFGSGSLRRAATPNPNPAAPPQVPTSPNPAAPPNPRARSRAAGRQALFGTGGLYRG